MPKLVDAFYVILNRKYVWFHLTLVAYIRPVPVYVVVNKKHFLKNNIKKVIVLIYCPTITIRIIYICILLLTVLK